MEINKIYPVFPITKTYLQEKQVENRKYSPKKSEKSFKSFLEKELQQKTRIDIRC